MTTSPKYQVIEDVVGTLGLATVFSMINIHHDIVSQQEPSPSRMAHENILRILYNRQRELVNT